MTDEQETAPLVPPKMLEEFRLATVAADALLEVVALRDPDFVATAEMRDAGVQLVRALAVALAGVRPNGGDRRSDEFQRSNATPNVPRQ